MTSRHMAMTLTSSERGQSVDKVLPTGVAWEKDKANALEGPSPLRPSLYQAVSVAHVSHRPSQLVPFLYVAYVHVAVTFAPFVGLNCIKKLLPRSAICVEDEAQFFDKNLPMVCNKLAEMNVRVICAGLDMDFKGQPFGPMPELIAVAEYVTKVHAICMRCGSLASFTFKKIHNDQTVELGEQELYEARCRKCFREGLATNREQLKMDL